MKNSKPLNEPPHSEEQDKNANSAVFRLSEVAKCFLSFGIEPSVNIRKLTQLSGELLGADAVMYYRMEGIRFTRLGVWKLPGMDEIQDLGSENSKNDLVQMAQGDIFKIKYLDHALNRSSPTSQTVRVWIGKLVKDQGIPVGALSVLFHEAHSISEIDREVLEIVTSAIAIEDRRLRAEELVVEQQAKLVVSGKWSALGEMAAGVAHEVNNPLLALLLRMDQMRALLESLRMKVLKDSNLDSQVIVEAIEEPLKSIEVLESMTTRISEVVKSLRTFSGDTEDDVFQEVLVRQFISEAVELCGARFKNHDIDLTIEGFRDDLKIKCRPTELARVILSLLYNSYDAIETSLGPKWIKIGVQTTSSHLELSITDSGGGIPLELRDRIFQPFFSTKEVNCGKGLGLSVARGIIEKHRGTLNLNEKSQNTCFIIRLPLSQDDLAIQRLNIKH